MDPTELFGMTRKALADTAARVAELVASAPDLSERAHGCDWTLQQVAAHLVAVAGYNTDMLNGVPSPFTSADPSITRQQSERLFGEIRETDPAKLSRLVAEAAECFVDTIGNRPADEIITYHCEMPYPISGMAGVYLGELVLHGYDIATALGRPWPIDPLVAQLVLAGTAPAFVLIVDPERTRGLSAGIMIDLRGGAAMTMRFTDGVLGFEEPGAGPVDATLAADPVAFLLVGSRRLTRYQAVALGLFTVGGDRPALALDLPDLFRYP